MMSFAVRISIISWLLVLPVASIRLIEDSQGYCNADNLFTAMMTFNAQTRNLPEEVYNREDSLNDIVCNTDKRNRNLQSDGLFSKGDLQAGSSYCDTTIGSARNYPGAVELLNWMKESCNKAQNQADLLLMGLEASVYVVTNQVFSDANHRTALFLVAQTMSPEDGSRFMQQVVSYDTGDAEFRSRIYNQLHLGYYFFVGHVPPTFTRGVILHDMHDPWWKGTLRGYVSLVESWMGTPIVVSAPVLRTTTAPDMLPCGASSPCSQGKCCDTTAKFFVPKYQNCKGRCVCLHTSEQCQSLR